MLNDADNETLSSGSGIEITVVGETLTLTGYQIWETWSVLEF